MLGCSWFTGLCIESDRGELLGSRDGWKIDALQAVELWLELTPGLSATPRWTLLGSMRDSAEPGWLVVDGGEPVEPESITGLCLAGAGGPDQLPGIPIEMFRHVDGELLVKCPAAAPAGHRLVWARSLSARQLVEGLWTGLAEIGDAPLVDAFAERRLSPVHAAGAPVPPGLVGPAADAFRACLSPGVRVVSGPAGAAQAQVLAGAVAALIDVGRKVLLVAPVNRAVDDALLAVVRAARPARGVAVRVGPPQLSTIAEDPDINIHRLGASASVEVDRELARVDRELAELAALDGEISRLAVELRGFDSAGFHAALLRIDNEQRVAELDRHLPDAEYEWEQASSHASAVRAIEQRAWQQIDRLAGEREALRTVAALTEDLRRLEAEHTSRRAELTSAEAQLTAVSNPLAGWRAKRAKETTTRTLRALDTLVADQWRRLQQLIDFHRTSALPITFEHIQRLEAEHAQAHSACEQADRAAAVASGRVQSMHGERLATRADGLPTETDRELVRRCVADDLLAKYQRLLGLRRRVPDSEYRRAELEDSHRLLLNRSAELREQAESRFVGDAQLVACTLVRARIDPAVASARFDVVLIVDAHAAPLVEVMSALAGASTTAVLFGEAGGPAPVVGPAIEESRSPRVRDLVCAGPFTHLRIYTAADAEQRPGCVSLPVADTVIDQHRDRHVANS